MTPDWLVLAGFLLWSSLAAGIAWWTVTGAHRWHRRRRGRAHSRRGPSTVPRRRATDHR